MLKNTQNHDETELQFISTLNSVTYLENVKLANAVLSFTNSSVIDMVKIKEYCDVKEYVYNSPMTFSGRTIKVPIVYEEINKPFSFVFFKTGKIVLLGLKRRDTNFLMHLKSELSNLIKSANASETVDLSYKLANKVYCLEIKKQYFLKPLTYWYNSLPANLKVNFEYNPAIFPGATLRVPTSRAVFLIFNSRKVIITGGTNELQSVNQSLNYLKIIIKYVLQKIQEQ